MKKKLTLYEAWIIFLKHPSPFLLLIIFLSFVGIRFIGLETSFSWKEGGVALGVMLYWPFQEWHQQVHRFPQSLNMTSFLVFAFYPKDIFRANHPLHQVND